jgi:hypothetical protein
MIISPWSVSTRSQGPPAFTSIPGKRFVVSVGDEVGVLETTSVGLGVGGTMGVAGSGGMGVGVVRKPTGKHRQPRLKIRRTARVKALRRVEDR